jgi:hypothetical protein
LSNFVDYLVWGLPSNTKYWVDIGVVSAAFVGNPTSKLLEVNLSVAISVKLVEQGSQLVVVEDTADSFKSLFELLWANGSVAFQVKMFEDALRRLALIVSSVSALTDLFKNNCLDLG